MSRVVRPSGSVAVFTFNPGFILDTSAATFTPPSLKELIDSTRLYSGPFAPFRTAGNAHTFQLYDHLPGPVDQQGWEPARRWRWGWKGKEDYGAVGQWDWEVQETEDGAPEIEKDMESEMTLGEVRFSPHFSLGLETHTDPTETSSLLSARDLLCLRLARAQVPRSTRPGPARLDRRQAGCHHRRGQGARGGRLGTRAQGQGPEGVWARRMEEVCVIDGEGRGGAGGMGDETKDDCSSVCKKLDCIETFQSLGCALLDSQPTPVHSRVSVGRTYFRPARRK